MAEPDMPSVDPGDAQRFRAAGWWRDTTFLDDLERTAHAEPDRFAVATYRHDTGETHTLTYGELWRHTLRCAAALHELGVRPGEVVGVQLPNRWELAPLLFACMRIGAVVNPYIPGYRGHELAGMVALTEPVVLIGASEIDGDQLAESVVRLAAESPSVREVFISGAPSAGARDFDEHFIATPWEEQVELPDRATAPDQPYLILFTSGTTGEPKGVVHTPNTLHAAIRGEADAYGLDESLVMSCAAVYTHYTGIVQGLFMPVMVGGGGMVFTDSHDADDLLRLAERFGVTFLYGSPALVRDLLDVAAQRKLDLSALQLFVAGSAPVPPHFIEEVRDTFGLRLHSLWGMSENGPVTMTRPDDPEDWAAHSDGRPVADMQWRIDLPDPVPEGQEPGVGLLRVKGPTQCLGYYKRAELYRSKLDADGFFDTGDLAKPDGRDGIRISGRDSEMVLSHGFIVPVTDLEALITAQPAVREAALVGVRDGQGDEVIHAYIALAGKEPFGAEEVRALFTDRDVMKYYWPREVHVIDQLPRTTTGKIRRNVLQERAADG
jgi:cyclohexanecarboxylate-CoA ligase